MIIELLAPAGNLEKLKIAFQYGADAVYLAGQHFGLRSAANNFSTDEISEAIRFAHDRHKKVYITVNAFLHDREMEHLPDFIKTLDQLGPDALICSDAGVVKTALKYSTIPIHISTQASVINSYHAQAWKNLGAKRIVVGRELSIKEAAILKKNTGLEIEMFVHGAMCMAYSGHCSFSTYVAKRDSNRGGCIQNCRFNYTLSSEDTTPQKAYFLSSKDLCGFRLLDQFIAAGINSLKIEGRMKSNLYIATCVRAYAQAIKEIETGSSLRTDFWMNELKKVPHRDYTEASLLTPAGPNSVYSGEKESGKEYKLAGTVLEVDPEKNRFAFHVKNRLYPGDVIEILPFSGDTIFNEIKEMVNMAEQIIEVAQPGNVFWMPLKKGIEPQNVARILR